jgi:hypothetical protein
MNQYKLRGFVGHAALRVAIQGFIEISNLGPIRISSGCFPLFSALFSSIVEIL